MADLEVLIDAEPERTVEDLAHEFVQIKLIESCTGNLKGEEQ